MSLIWYAPRCLQCVAVCCSVLQCVVKDEPDMVCSPFLLLVVVMHVLCLRSCCACCACALSLRALCLVMLCVVHDLCLVMWCVWCKTPVCWMWSIYLTCSVSRALPQGVGDTAYTPLA